MNTCDPRTGNITSCLEEYFPNGETCSLCTSKNHTRTCDSQTGHALTCVNGFYVDTNNVCSECGLNCDVCESPTSCTTCSTNYYPNEGICRLCVEKDNVKTCDPKTGDVFTCSKGFYINANGACAQCG